MGSKNGIGGRSGAVMINEEVNESGTPQHKTSQRVSTIYGMNFAFEALPPYHVIQSTAENPRIQQRFNNEMHHVIGNFGFSEIDGNIRSFPNGVSWSEDGSVTDEIFIRYIEHFLCPLYKDAKDEEGFRVGMKVDSGPGRLNKQFWEIARSYGFYFFPGLPNGTELGQEMDQLFAFLKSIIEENRKELYKILFRQCEGRVPEDDEDDDGFCIIEEKEDGEDCELVDVDAIDGHFYDLSQQ